MVSPWRDPGQQLPEACCARRARLVWYSCYTLTFLDLLGDRFGLVWYSWYTRTFLDLLGDRFGLVWFSCYTLTILDLLGDRFGLVWYSWYILEHVLIRLVTDSRCPILVSDSTILVSDPANPVTDSDILVSDS